MQAVTGELPQADTNLFDNTQRRTRLALNWYSWFPRVAHFLKASFSTELSNARIEGKTFIQGRGQLRGQVFGLA
jgi:hypothetical protein